jgi:hypothetical protein
MTIGYTFSPNAQLVWRATDAHTKTITLVNTGTDDIWVEVDPPVAPTTDDFQWPAQTSLRIAGKPQNGPASAFQRVIVPPTPRTGLGLRTGEVRFRIKDSYGQLVEDKPIALRNDATAKIEFGDVAVTMFTFDPTGDDLSGEGEFVELTNLTNRILDFAGSTLSQTVFSPTTPGQPRPAGRLEALVTFAADAASIDFRNDCMLPPMATLRILTRGLRSNEGPATVPNFRQRLYLGRGSAVWNNTGDRCVLTNEFGDSVCAQGYGTEALAGPNGPIAPVTPQTPSVLTPPGQRQTVLLPTPFFVFANAAMHFPPVFQLQDGDLVTITTNEDALVAAWLGSAGTPTGTIKLDPLGPLILPSGARLAAFFARWIEPAVLATEILPSIFARHSTPDQFNLIGAPEGGLIGQIGNSGPFFIGRGTSFIARLGVPAPLRLGVNDIDGAHLNNLGVFVATVSVQR